MIKIAMLLICAALFLELCLPLTVRAEDLTANVAAAAEDPNPSEGEGEPVQDNPEEEVVEGLTQEEWDAFTPKLKNVPKTLKAGRKKQISTNAPEGVSVTYKVSNSKATIKKKKGLLRAKRVGIVHITATFTATVEGETMEKTVRSKKVQILGKKKIFIDPGHQSRANLSQEQRGPGSSYTNMKVSGGCTGVATGIPEYKFTLRVARKLRKALLEKGYAVVMSRTRNNVDISNKERALKANECGANITIRIHADSYTDGSVRGASVLYASKSNPFPISKYAKKSKKLANCLLKNYCNATGIGSRGLYVRNDLVGLNWSEMPNVLIECGFFSNPAEDRYLNNAQNQDIMVQGMVDGIDEYFGY